MKLTPFALPFALLLATAIAQFAYAPLSAADEEKPILLARYGGGDSCRKCRSYALAIYESGRVIYNGTTIYYEVPPNSSMSVERGVREAIVSTEAVNRWVGQLVQEEFYSLPPSYDGRSCPRDGGQERAITLNVGEETKTVVWVECLGSNVPRGLREVAKGIKDHVAPGQWQKLILPLDR